MEINFMKALTLEKPFNLTYADVELPSLPSQWATLRVVSVSVCGSDFHAFRGGNPMQTYPRILGHEVCAIVEETNGESEAIHVGDKVILMPYLSCGVCKACRKGKYNACSSLSVYGVHREGAMATYVQAPFEQLIRIESSVNNIDAALIEPLAISAHAVRRAQVSENDTVLVSGAGFIGLGVALQAQLHGCSIILADTDEKRRAFARKHSEGFLGVFDPLGEDYARKISELTNGEGPDCIIDATGNHFSMEANLQYLSNGGRMVFVGISKDPITLPGKDFHVRETELLDSRAATLEDFKQVVDFLQKKVLSPKSLVTHTAQFNAEIVSKFQQWNELGGEVFKAVIQMVE